MPKRELVMLAQVLKGDFAMLPAGSWAVSEKLDGMRAFWDGGLFRGSRLSAVPWATDKGVNPEGVATGLWSRYGKVLHAPDWWLDTLPRVMLDGELWMGRGRFNDVMSICRRSVNTLVGEWAKVNYHVFEAPSAVAMGVGGEIHNSVVKRFSVPRCSEMLESVSLLAGRAPFREVYDLLLGLEAGVVKVVRQESYVDGDWLTEKYNATINAGGEGLMLRQWWSTYECRRSSCILKIKPELEGSGVVVGFVGGEDGFSGMLGALVVEEDSKVRFKLGSGFTHQQRAVDGDGRSAVFKLGDRVRFLFRERTPDGLPKEGRFYGRG